MFVQVRRLSAFEVVQMQTVIPSILAFLIGSGSSFEKQADLCPRGTTLDVKRRWSEGELNTRFSPYDASLEAQPSFHKAAWESCVGTVPSELPIEGL